PAEPVVADLFSFDDDDDVASQNIAPISAPARSTSHAADLFTAFAPPAAAASTPTKADADDDWGDFQCSGSGSGGTTFFSASQQQQQQPPIAKHTSSAAAMDLLGGDDFGPVAFQPLATPAAPKPVPTLAATTTTKTVSAFDAVSPAKGNSAAQKNAFSDIWDMSSGLVSLDSLSLTDKNKSGGVSMNQQLSSQQKSAY
ncbi:hypothetical protein IWW38_001183, partial [Coemansia aciculifera]